MVEIVDLLETDFTKYDPRNVVILRLYTTYPLHEYAAVVEADRYINHLRDVESELYFAFSKKVTNAFRIATYREATAELIDRSKRGKSDMPY